MTRIVPISDTEIKKSLKERISSIKPFLPPLLDLKSLVCEHWSNWRTPAGFSKIENVYYNKSTHSELTMLLEKIAEKHKNTA